jgi:hypothetical protein
MVLILYLTQFFHSLYSKSYKWVPYERQCKKIDEEQVVLKRLCKVPLIVDNLQQDLIRGIIC